LGIGWVIERYSQDSEWLGCGSRGQGSGPPWGWYKKKSVIKKVRFTPVGRRRNAGREILGRKGGEKQVGSEAHSCVAGRRMFSGQTAEERRTQGGTETERGTGSCNSLSIKEN